eukprot:NP_872264.1 Uncharacterized protein CELE_Y108F1.5 [Caenorhabditis elegans]
MINGLELLYALGAIDETSQLTSPLGLQMAEFPLPPMHSKCLLKSAEFGCFTEMVTIVAMMQIQDVFITPYRQRHQADVIRKKFAVEEGNHITMLNVFTKFVENGRSKKWCSDHFVNYRGLMRADNVRSQLVRLLKRFEIEKVSSRGHYTKVDIFHDKNDKFEFLQFKTIDIFRNYRFLNRKIDNFWNFSFLAFHSTFFESLSLGGFYEAKLAEVPLYDIDVDDFQKFLEVLYGFPVINDNTVEGILLLADMYQTPLVSELCEDFLIETTGKTYKKKLQMAITFNLENLKQFCISMIKSPFGLRSMIPSDISSIDHSTLAALFTKSLTLMK